jgi:hypothetical protein
MIQDSSAARNSSAVATIMPGALADQAPAEAADQRADERGEKDDARHALSPSSR